MARLRLQAACCVLKLAQEKAFADLVTSDLYQSCALLLNVSVTCMFGVMYSVIIWLQKMWCILGPL